MELSSPRPWPFFGPECEPAHELLVCPPWAELLGLVRYEADDKNLETLLSRYRLAEQFLVNDDPSLSEVHKKVIELGYEVENGESSIKRRQTLLFMCSGTSVSWMSITRPPTSREST